MVLNLLKGIEWCRMVLNLLNGFEFVEYVEYV